MAYARQEQGEHRSRSPWLPFWGGAPHRQCGDQLTKGLDAAQVKQPPCCRAGVLQVITRSLAVMRRVVSRHTWQTECSTTTRCQQGGQGNKLPKKPLGEAKGTAKRVTPTPAHTMQPLCRCIMSGSRANTRHSFHPTLLELWRHPYRIPLLTSVACTCGQGP